MEGRYDQNTLAQVVDATVVTLGGFAVFNDKEKGGLSPALGSGAGTDRPDGQRRRWFCDPQLPEGALPKEQVKQAYIPDIPGKEKRKRAPGKEGKLGVEGMKPEVILEALRRAGATFLDEETAPAPERSQYQGRPDGVGAGRRSGQQSAAASTARRLDLPEHLTANGMLEALNLLTDREELERALTTEEL